MNRPTQRKGVYNNLEVVPSIFVSCCNAATWELVDTLTSAYEFSILQLSILQQTNCLPLLG